MGGPKNLFLKCLQQWLVRMQWTHKECCESFHSSSVLELGFIIKTCVFVYFAFFSICSVVFANVLVTLVILRGAEFRSSEFAPFTC
jgi:hypothetical protein